MTGRPLSARLQLLFYGLIPRLHHDNSLNMTCASFRAKLATVEHIVLPPLLENVLLPATARTQTDALHFNAVDVYGHTWRLAQEPCTDFSQDEMLQTTVERGLVAPQVKTRSIVLEFGQATSNYHPRVQWALTTYAYLNALVSIERAIKLLPLHSVSPVLLMRWDTIFLTRMHLSTLNWQLFYRVNFCMTSGPASGNGVVVGGSRAPSQQVRATAIFWGHYLQTRTRNRGLLVCGKLDSDDFGLRRCSHRLCARPIQTTALRRLARRH